MHKKHNMFVAALSLAWPVLGASCNQRLVQPRKPASTDLKVGASHDLSDATLASPWISPTERVRLRSMDISFRDQDGQNGLLRDLVDRPTLVTFFYSRCHNAGKCSAAIARLAELQAQLAAQALDTKVRLLAITYEPQFDTPEGIKQYAEARGLHFDAWARGLQLNAEDLNKITAELQLPVNFNRGWVNTHGLMLSVIDERGALARQYDTLLWENQQVIADVRLLLSGR